MSETLNIAVRMIGRIKEGVAQFSCDNGEHWANISDLNAFTAKASLPEPKAKYIKLMDPTATPAWVRGYTEENIKLNNGTTELAWILVEMPDLKAENDRLKNELSELSGKWEKSLLKEREAHQNTIDEMQGALGRYVEGLEQTVKNWSFSIGSRQTTEAYKLVAQQLRESPIFSKVIKSRHDSEKNAVQ